MNAYSRFQHPDAYGRTKAHAERYVLSMNGTPLQRKHVQTEEKVHLPSSRVKKKALH